MNDKEIPLNKYISLCGVTARRKAAEFIKQGKVTVNNKEVTSPGYKVKATDKVRVRGKIVKPRKKVYLLLNKPKDFLSTVSDERGRKTVIDLIKYATKELVHPIGRLDRNTTGLLILTNDGELTQRLAHPKYKIQKTYRIMLDQPLKTIDFEKIKKGVMLKDGKVRVDGIYYLAGKRKNYVKLTLHSGKYRVIRRLFKKLGYNVIKLDRIKYAHLTKRGLSVGKWRFLSHKEIERLKQLSDVP